jgi:hypothetical protein
MRRAHQCICTLAPSMPMQARRRRALSGQSQFRTRDLKKQSRPCVVAQSERFNMCKENTNKSPEFNYNMYDKKYFVKYMEADRNWYRAPTGWEKFRSSISSFLRKVFVLPSVSLYGSIKSFFCAFRCKKDVEISGLRSCNSILWDRVQELELQNKILRQGIQKSLESQGQKKKAAKKRPSSKKRKAT